MKLYIRNMVCSRCIMAVRNELEKVGLTPLSVELGEVWIQEDDISAVKAELLKGLKGLGFDIIDDKNTKTIDKIKSLIIDLVHNKENDIDIKLSEYLAKKLFQDYSTLSHLFSEIESTTIEKFYIQQKIEKVKELLTYDELSLNEIAFKLNYSSASHLSKQFKKVTGLSPTHFKKLKDNKRRQIEDL